MGAHPYQYVIEYQDDPAAALAHLRQAVFQRGDYYGAHRHPRTPAEVERYFGTPTPTVAMVEQCDQLWDDLERGMARYVVTYEQRAPRHLLFVGYSFD